MALVAVWPTTTTSPVAAPTSKRTSEVTMGTSGATLIAVERERQMSVEGWTPEHDDQHISGELIAAACAYAMHADPDGAGEFAVDVWPWDESFWKPSQADPVRDLVKAGALIAAEIDRRLRAEFKETGTIRLVIVPDPNLPLSIWPNLGSVILTQEEGGTFGVAQVGGVHMAGFLTEEAALTAAQEAWPRIESFEEIPLASTRTKAARLRNR